jgi:hypothetical protein
MNPTSVPNYARQEATIPISLRNEQVIRRSSGVERVIEDIKKACALNPKNTQLAVCSRPIQRESEGRFRFDRRMLTAPIFQVWAACPKNVKSNPNEDYIQ